MFQFWDFIPDVVYSFSLALLIAIGIEGPFRKMEKYFIVKRKKVPKSESDESNKNASEELKKSVEPKKID